MLGTIRIKCIVLLKLNICKEKIFKFSPVIGYAEFARWPDNGSTLSPGVVATATFTSSFIMRIKPASTYEDGARGVAVG